MKKKPCFNELNYSNDVLHDVTYVKVLHESNNLQIAINISMLMRYSRRRSTIKISYTKTYLESHY